MLVAFLYLLICFMTRSFKIMFPWTTGNLDFFSSSQISLCTSRHADKFISFLRFKLVLTEYLHFAFLGFPLANSIGGEQWKVQG